MLRVSFSAKRFWHVRQFFVYFYAREDDNIK